MSDRISDPPFQNADERRAAASWMKQVFDKYPQEAVVVDGKPKVSMNAALARIESQVLAHPDMERWAYVSRLIYWAKHWKKNPGSLMINPIKHELTSEELSNIFTDYAIVIFMSVARRNGRDHWVLELLDDQVKESYQNFLEMHRHRRIAHSNTSLSSTDSPKVWTPVQSMMPNDGQTVAFRCALATHRFSVADVEEFEQLVEVARNTMHLTMAAEMLGWMPVPPCQEVPL